MIVCLFICLLVCLFVIAETERLKREEMDRTLANKLQETGEAAGVQTWLSRELIGFNHTKNRFVLFLELSLLKYSDNLLRECVEVVLTPLRIIYNIKLLSLSIY